MSHWVVAEGKADTPGHCPCSLHYSHELRLYGIQQPSQAQLMQASRFWAAGGSSSEEEEDDTSVEDSDTESASSSSSDDSGPAKNR